MFDFSKIAVTGVGEVLTAKNGNNFVAVDFGKFGMKYPATRLLFADSDGNWERGFTPEVMEKAQKAGVDFSPMCEIVNVDIEPYTYVNKTSGLERTVKSLNVVRFSDESLEQAVAASGRKLLQQAQVVQEPASIAE